MPHIANVPGPTAAPSHASAPRRLQGGRKKANPAADDAAYHGASTSGVVGGTKRTAADKPEGEPRMKRKRVDMTMAGGNMGGGSASTSGLRRPDRPLNADGRPSLIDFTTLPTDALYRYLQQFDVIPEVDPSPLTAQDPPPPSSLLQLRGERCSSSASPAPVPLPVTPANRPRRETSANANRRRSSRLLEDERRSTITPILADIAEFHGTLASIAEKHFHQDTLKEVETLTSFMCAVKAKGGGGWILGE